MFLSFTLQGKEINQAFAKFNGKSKQKSAFIIRNFTITGVYPENCCLCLYMVNFLKFQYFSLSVVKYNVGYQSWN